MNRDDLKKNFAAGLRWLLALVGTVVITGLIKGDQLKGLSGLGKFKATIWTGVPLWGCLLAVVVVAAAVHFWGVYDRKKPKLAVFWHGERCFWWRQDKNPDAMTLVGEGMFTLTNSDGPITIVRAFPRKTHPIASLTNSIQVLPGQPNKIMFDTAVLPTSKATSMGLYVSMVFVDTANREYVLPRQVFLPIPQAAKVPESMTPSPTSPTPVITIVWRLSGWCWAKQSDEEVVFLTGDFYLQIDNVPEPVLIVDVRVEGAERVSVFEDFELTPGQRTVLGFGQQYKGLNPIGQAPITAKMTFVDFKGNHYPVKENTFKALPDPERYNGISWANMRS